MTTSKRSKGNTSKKEKLSFGEKLMRITNVFFE